MISKCQTRDTRTINLIEAMREMEGDTYLRLHTILCMRFSFDKTADDMQDALINHLMIAEAMDKIQAGDTNFNAWDLGKGKEEMAA